MYGVQVVEEPVVSVLGEGLSGLSPEMLLLVLSSVDRDRLSAYDRVALVEARVRLRSHIEAELMADMVSVFEAESELLKDELPIDELLDLTAAEIGAALVWTRRMSESQVEFAFRVVSDYPRVWEALSEGRIDMARVRVIVEHTSHLDPETRDQVVETILSQASHQTTGLLRSRIRRLCIWVDPDDAKKRYEEGLEERRVVGEENQDGTANIHGLSLSPRDVAAALRRINRLARKGRSEDDPRTMDQIRADIFVELVCGRTPTETRDRGVVDIRVDLTTLINLDDHPGELSGWGPVIADIARQTTKDQTDAEWRYTVTAPDGEVVSVGTTRRRPTTSQRRRVEAQTPTCAFPGCRMPSVDCDLDHNQPHSQDGPTTEQNLGPLCRHHHVIRHHGWTITQIHPGVYQLTSPLGHTYTTRPRAP